MPVIGLSLAFGDTVGSGRASRLAHGTENVGKTTIALSAGCLRNPLEAATLGKDE
jgi:hypothetical protein